MEVIVSHMGTDFDALAAMVACSKLHSGAKMILVGSQRPGVRQFIALHRDSLRLYRTDQLPLTKIAKLYIVDAPDCQRLGDAAWLCQRAEQVIVYDHHPPFDQPGPGIRQRLGAATTILVEGLQQANISISPFEATLFLLGIYEDTRCLTSLSTTVRDLKAATWLLEQGASLAEVSKYINIPLSGEQKELFEALLSDAITLKINGRNILITVATLEQFVGGLGLLTQRLAELEDCDLAISIVQMEKRVHLVARSQRPDLDMLEVLEPLGVKGHAAAVTLTKKDVTPPEMLDRVKALLEARLPKGLVARDLMSAPVKTISEDTTVAEAHRLLLRYGHTGMPVIDGNQVVVGIVSRRDIEKAMRHELGHAPVRGYMSRNVISANPEMSIEDVTRLIIQNDIGRVPVLEKGQLVGIITRTDVLRRIHGESAPRWHKPLFNAGDYRIAPFRDNLTDLINDRLPKRIQGLLLLLGQKAAKEGFKVYAVGGFVRDLVLGLSNYDLDLAVEENAVEFANLLPPLLGGKLNVHPEFGTATLTLSDGFQIDFATARMEFYQFPAASPEVEQATIKHDLYRRDFTINTLAFSLNSGSFGKFLDFFGGYDDLQAGLIRVLYNLSFVEDPTRILRAIRFACRYGFKLEEETRGFMETAIQDNMLAKTPAARLGREFRIIFHESNVPALLTMARDLGVMKSILGSGEWPPELDAQLLAAARVVQWAREQNLAETESWLVYPFLLLNSISQVQRAAAAQRLGLTPKEEKTIQMISQEIEPVSQELKRDLPPSEIYNLLRPLPVAALLALLAVNSGEAALRSRIMLYLERLAVVEISIDGHDLLSMGVQPGPEVGRILREVRMARLDGEVATREQELALAASLLKGGNTGVS